MSKATFQAGLAAGIVSGMRFTMVVENRPPEPTVYLYNGIALPSIYSVYTPELQKKYPYAVLGLNYITGRLNLCVSEDKFEYISFWGIGVLPINGIAKTFRIYDTGFVPTGYYPDEEPPSLNPAFWSNHAIAEDESGEVVIPAGDIIPDFSTYRYYLCKGHKLPVFPEWNTDAYPYAAVFDCSDIMEGQELVISNMPYMIMKTDNGYPWFYTGGRPSFVTFSNFGTRWEKRNEYVSDGSGMIIRSDPAIWSNHNIIDVNGDFGEKGSVYFEAYEPIPTT